MRFGSMMGASRNQPSPHQSPNVSSISEKLHSVKSGMRKAGSLSSIMDKFLRSGDSKRVTRPQVEIVYDDEEEEGPEMEVGILPTNVIASKGQMLRKEPLPKPQRKEPSLLHSTSESKEYDENQCVNQTLPKPRRKLFSGKMPSLRKMSNSLRRKSRKIDAKREGEETENTAGGQDLTEMVEINEKQQCSLFEYDDANCVHSSTGRDSHNTGSAFR